MKKTLHRTWLAVLILLLVGACEQKPVIVPSGKTIKIGVIAPFSGSDVTKGKEGLKGVRAVTQIQPLLKNGDRIEIVTKNDHNDPRRSVLALHELAEKEKVAAVLTLSGSGPVLSMARVADRYKVPILAGLATHPEVTRKSNYVSQVCFDNIFQGKVAALFVRDELLLDRVAVFLTPGSYYSHNLATEFIQKFTSLDGEITDKVLLNDQNVDMLELIQTVRDKNPDLLYLPVAANYVVAVSQALDRLGWEVQLMGSDGLLATVTAQYADQLENLEGIFATDFFHNSSQFTRFGKQLKTSWKGSRTSYAAMAVEGFALLLDAINRCTDPHSRACINQQIRSTHNFMGLLGYISIDVHGKAQRPLVINAIKDKEIKHIVKVF